MYLFQSSVWQCLCVSMNVNAMRTYTLVLRVVQVRLWTCFRYDKMVVVCFGLTAFPSCCCFCWFCCVLRANYQANGEFIRCVFVWINSPHPLETKRHSTVQKAFFALCKAFYPFTKNYLQQQQQQQQKTYTYVRKKEYIYSTFRMNIFGNCNLVSSRLQSGSILIKTEEFRKNATWGIK